jgi:hypothetical protein
MKKVIIVISCICVFFATSCKTLSSTTFIGPKDSFILGNNEHGAYQVDLKNVSPNALNLHLAPIGGGTHSPVEVQPNQKLSLKVDKNTALIIGNQSDQQATVQLKVIGDTGLSMGYKNH